MDTKLRAASLMVLALLIGVSGGIDSGLYEDNGSYQTVKLESMSSDDIQAMKQILSSTLDLPVLQLNALPFSSTRRSAPTHLLDIYGRLHDEEGIDMGTRAKRSADSKHDIRAVDNDRILDRSDNIMTFTAKGNRNYGNGVNLCFEINHIVPKSKVLLAVLHVYKRFGSVKHSTNSTVSIHEFTPSLTKLTKINLQPISADYEGWIEVNVTETLAKWICTARKRGILHMTINNNIHTTYRSLSLYDDNAHRPFITGYFQGENVVQRLQLNAKHRRQRRSIRTNPLTDSGRSTRLSGAGGCRMRILYVSFRDLRWKSWILAPDGYNAFYCSGECSFPLNAHANATNHAQIQMLAHLMHPRRIPKPSCVPTKTTALSVLYFVNDIDVNLRKYRNIVARQCGCH